MALGDTVFVVNRRRSGCGEVAMGGRTRQSGRQVSTELAAGATFVIAVDGVFNLVLQQVCLGEHHGNQQCDDQQAQAG